MIRQNLHTHTVFDDGKNTPDEMARAALDAGLTSLGFSGHSILPYENDWSLTPERLPDYLSAVEETKAAYAGRLEIFSGLEWDGVSPQDRSGFDYIIGSLHHIAVNGEYPSIDDTPEETRRILTRYFRDDQESMTEAYFAQYDVLAEDTAVDIVGHFDLLRKFSEKDTSLFPCTPFFRDCAMAALERLVRADKIFEVNTGAMAKGWRTVPYPAPWLLKELRARNARVLVSSDAHAAGTVAYGFADAEALLRELGFRETWRFTAGGFLPERL